MPWFLLLTTVIVGAFTDIPQVQVWILWYRCLHAFIGYLGTSL